ncbi:hypothetical protein K3495_g6800 [Podosphaera aphanis]|nr:hypothetical protein K3495_g6800 [Podosphaera aphanis]
MRRPAPHRLLLRPAIIGFLRCLFRSSLSRTQRAPIYIGKTELPSPFETSNPCTSSQNPSGALDSNELSVIEGCSSGSLTIRAIYPKPCVKALGKIGLLYGHWELEIWDHDRLEFESDLDDGREGKSLDRLSDREYMKLWGYLLNHRYSAHGLAGVQMYWKAVLKKELYLPVTGALADKLWSTFLQLGFQNLEILDQIIEYANKLFKVKGIRWLALYDNILEHLLVNGKYNYTLKCHERLFPLHPPGAARFRTLFREVLHRKGNELALKTIYKLCPYRNVYSGVISLYCKRGEFQRATDWHFFLLENGDQPSKAAMVEPLIKYLSIHDKSRNVLVAQSLVDIGISKSQLVSELSTIKVSAEMMNRIHGKTFGIQEKNYDDALGARWFATSWVSLDTAIKTIHALGIQEIGPLSLQAIALRDPSAESILYNIKQLRRFGISIGTSMFAKSLKHFARNGRLEFLQGLLNSDQHPDQLDNVKLQEDLLLAYSQARDWEQFYRTLEILSLACKNPKVGKRNLLLKVILLDGSDISTVLEALDKMIKDHIPVKPDTISHLLGRILTPRRRTKPPSNTVSDLNLGIKVLHDIMCSGSDVPVYYWREIIRRLGMRGRLDHLENLSLILARWYIKGGVEGITCYKKPSVLPLRHALHPARILFNRTFQRAVVDWGFIHQLGITQRQIIAKLKLASTNGDPFNLPDLTFGIILLKKLRKLGVFIDGQVVSRAILNRLIAYYGPGISTKRYNQVAQTLVQGRLREMVKQIDGALGSTYFTGLNLPVYLRRLGRVKLHRLEKSRSRAEMKGCALRTHAFLPKVI